MVTAIIEVFMILWDELYYFLLMKVCVVLSGIVSQLSPPRDHH
jgi:hypothetical protein